MKIDYRKIDKEFRPLIRELNKAGLITTQCCSGHNNKYLKYLSISLKNIIDVSIREKGTRLVLWWGRSKTKLYYVSEEKAYLSKEA